MTQKRARTNTTVDSGYRAIPAPPANVDPAVRSWMQAITESLQVRLGTQGNALDKAVTFRQLESLGLAKSNGNSGFVNPYLEGFGDEFEPTLTSDTFLIEPFVDQTPSGTIASIGFTVTYVWPDIQGLDRLELYWSDAFATPVEIDGTYPFNVSTPDRSVAFDKANKNPAVQTLRVELPVVDYYDKYVVVTGRFFDTKDRTSDFQPTSSGVRLFLGLLTAPEVPVVTVTANANVVRVSWVTAPSEPNSVDVDVWITGPHDAAPDNPAAGGIALSPEASGFDGWLLAARSRESSFGFRGEPGKVYYVYVRGYNAGGTPSEWHQEYGTRVVLGWTAGALVAQVSNYINNTYVSPDPMPEGFGDIWYQERSYDDGAGRTGFGVLLKSQHEAVTGATAPSPSDAGVNEQNSVFLVHADYLGFGARRDVNGPDLEYTYPFSIGINPEYAADNTKPYQIVTMDGAYIKDLTVDNAKIIEGVWTAKLNLGDSSYFAGNYFKGGRIQLTSPTDSFIAVGLDTTTGPVPVGDTADTWNQEYYWAGGESDGQGGILPFADANGDPTNISDTPVSWNFLLRGDGSLFAKRVNIQGDIYANGLFVPNPNATPGDEWRYIDSTGGNLTLDKSTITDALIVLGVPISPTFIVDVNGQADTGTIASTSGSGTTYDRAVTGAAIDVEEYVSSGFVYASLQISSTWYMFLDGVASFKPGYKRRIKASIGYQYTLVANPGPDDWISGNDWASFIPQRVSGTSDWDVNGADSETENNNGFRSQGAVPFELVQNTKFVRPLVRWHVLVDGDGVNKDTRAYLTDTAAIISLIFGRTVVAHSDTDTNFIVQDNSITEVKLVEEFRKTIPRTSSPAAGKVAFQAITGTTGGEVSESVLAMTQNASGDYVIDAKHLPDAGDAVPAPKLVEVGNSYELRDPVDDTVITKFYFDAASSRHRVAKSYQHAETVFLSTTQFSGQTPYLQNADGDNLLRIRDTSLTPKTFSGRSIHDHDVYGLQLRSSRWLFNPYYIPAILSSHMMGINKSYANAAQVNPDAAYSSSIANMVSLVRIRPGSDATVVKTYDVSCTGRNGNPVAVTGLFAYFVIKTSVLNGRTPTVEFVPQGVDTNGYPSTMTARLYLSGTHVSAYDQTVHSFGSVRTAGGSRVSKDSARIRSINMYDNPNGSSVGSDYDDNDEITLITAVDFCAYEDTGTFYQNINPADTDWNFWSQILITYQQMY